jgi:hypothetical protein
MTIKLTLAPELEFKLKQEADRRGLPPEQYALEVWMNTSLIPHGQELKNWLNCFDSGMKQRLMRVRRLTMNSFAGWKKIGSLFVKLLCLNNEARYGESGNPARYNPARISDSP